MYTDMMFLFYYLGLIVFSLNGLQLVFMRSRALELAAHEERLRRLIIRRKIRINR